MTLGRLSWRLARGTGHGFPSKVRGFNVRDARFWGGQYTAKMLKAEGRRRLKVRSPPVGAKATAFDLVQASIPS